MKEERGLCLGKAYTGAKPILSAMELSWAYYALPIAILVACAIYIIWVKLRHQKKGKGI